MLEKQFKLTRPEYQHMALRMYWNLPANRQRRQAGQIFTILALFCVVWSSAGIFWGGFAALMAGLLYPILLRRYLYAAYGRVFDMQAAVFKEVTIQINETCLKAWRPHLRSEIDWEAISRIDEDSVGFYMQYGPLQTAFIPRRVFADAAEAQEFWTLAQTFIEHARPTPLKPLRAQV